MIIQDMEGPKSAYIRSRDLTSQLNAALSSLVIIGLYLLQQDKKDTSQLKIVLVHQRNL